MGNGHSFLIPAGGRAVLAIALGICCQLALRAQSVPPKYEVEANWPKPLPDRWVTGGVGGVCVDAQDHVFILNRRDLTDNDFDAGQQAPPVMEFDPDGNLVNSWGDPKVVPDTPHGCTIDRDQNIWLTGSDDGMVQKYSHDGSKLLLQIGKKGVIDSSDGTVKGKPLNSGHSAFFKPSGIAIDPKNGDVYVSDGEGAGGNHRIAVFDRNGQFLRQWELERAPNETGEAFTPIIHCVAMDCDGLVYACDRRGDRLQVFDKTGKFQKNIPIKFERHSQPAAGPGPRSGSLGTAVWAAFSPDPAERFIYVTNQDGEEIEILDRSSGKILSSFGRVGHQAGEFTYAHFAAVDSKGDVYVTEVGVGKRVQKFKPVGGQ